ncbi:MULTISPECIES: cell wall metabolism sensor histidine kinase WalK [Psychrobacter]|uniref:sensor histidine kinase n=1 Tax=Psychrobacter TaxID=497 RepID=UPI00146EDBAF|nr:MULTISPECIES: ATP-binding protein [Psychrobacter]
MSERFSIQKWLISPKLSLFWRLFLSLLLIILLTSMLSVAAERKLNQRALAAKMEEQIDKLVIKREVLTQALLAQNDEELRRLYRDDRRLMSQIRVFDDQGEMLFPRYRFREGRQEGRLERLEGRPPRSDERSPELRPPPIEDHAFMEKPFQLSDIWQPLPPYNAISNMDRRPELADKTITLPNGQIRIIQLRPHLLFKDVLELQRGNMPIRLVMVVFFGGLVCFWLSQTMTRRIRRVQNSVHRLLVGDYATNPSLEKLGDDELGQLAKDVAQLSTRLSESERARKQMLSDISHELRSPLARLEVATELTRDFAPNAGRYLDRIDKESARMNELIEQIIRIQSLQMQQYSLDDSEREPVDLAQIISDIGQDVCFEFQHKQIAWQWQPPPFECIVMGNFDQLRSALENIIRNAFMHTPQALTIAVDLTKVTHDKGRLQWQMTVTDSGSGIDEADLARIFQPFVRLDSARHRQTGGYGLGLAITHAVVVAHGGHVRVYNRQDGQSGLVVEVMLPAS